MESLKNNGLARVLVIETSGATGLVAVGSGAQILGRRLLAEARRHTRDLTIHVRDLLAQPNWQTRDLTAIVVGTGPGSYTGLRVGIASAKALAFATGCALFGVPAFDAIAGGFDEPGETLEIIADALQGNIYSQRFRRAEGGEWWRAMAPLSIRQFEVWAAQLTVESWVAGPGLELYRSQLPPQARVPGDAHRAPTPEAMIGLVASRPEQYRIDCRQIEPIYLRGSSAEENAKRPKETNTG
jgi:tRNA threonylcarbamoyladenosine biosynthesis protein TsaB